MKLNIWGTDYYDNDIWGNKRELQILAWWIQLPSWWIEDRLKDMFVFTYENIGAFFVSYFALPDGYKVVPLLFLIIFLIAWANFQFFIF